MGVFYLGRYIAPELVYRDPASGAVCVRSPADPRFEALRSAAALADEAPTWVEAAPAQDLWQLGAVLYQLATGAPLWLCDADGNCNEDGLRTLAEWSDALKREKLRQVPRLVHARWRSDRIRGTQLISVPPPTKTPSGKRCKMTGGSLARTAKISHSALQALAVPISRSVTAPRGRPVSG